MDPQVLKIYSATHSPRLNYIAGIIFGDILGLKWEVVTDRRKVGKSPLINYSVEEIPKSLQIYPCGILFEKGLMKREPEVLVWKGLPAFFMSQGGSGLPFDIFGASFWLITRYEEYCEFTADEHGRFPARESLAFKSGFLKKPVIDLWARELARELVKVFPTLVFRRDDYKAIVTFDTDQPFAYLGIGLLRNVGGMLRDITGKNRAVTMRYKVVSHDEKDPFEVFDYILSQINGAEAESVFFFPTGDDSKYDKNPSWRSDDYVKLIQKIKKVSRFGIHPSYYASENRRHLVSEVERLLKITGEKISLSRFHFIRMKMPDSYRFLMEAGIKEDYSMGFPDEPGFRAGISRPFNFYDLVHEKVTDLIIHPFQVMDVTLYNYLKLNYTEAEVLIRQLIDETRRAGGTFISLWHNTSLLETDEWRGWRGLFEKMLSLQKP